MTDATHSLLLDANLLIWAHHRQFPQHRAARAWLADVVSEVPVVGIPWGSILAFVRISTHPRVLERPLDVPTAIASVREWLDQPAVTIPTPGERHVDLFADLMLRGKATGNHAPDAHLAALALEHGMVLASADRDFARYAGVRWTDPSAAWT